MNGLEAIELMKQGKMIESDSYFTRYIKDGVMYSVTPNGDVVSNDFDINYEDYRECKPNPLTGWERVGEREKYYVIDRTRVDNEIEDSNFLPHVDSRLYENANYFSAREKAEEINFKQTLFRKLQRFSDENGGNEIDWSNKEPKFYIHYCSSTNEFVPCISISTISFGQVYFISFEVAVKAIELFNDELIKYFTQYK